MAKSVSRHVDIPGLGEFKQSVENLAVMWPAAVKEANFQLASAIVTTAVGYAQTARKSAPLASQSLRASRAKKAAVIRYGGPKAPYAMGAEFGSTKYRQFRPFTRSGYFLFPALRAKTRNAEELFSSVLRGVSSKAFPD